MLYVWSEFTVTGTMQGSHNILRLPPFYRLFTPTRKLRRRLRVANTEKRRLPLLLRPCRGAVCTMEAVSSLTALARRGYCAPTKSFAAGDCAVGGMGTWPLHGLTPLASCVQR